MTDILLEVQGADAIAGGAIQAQGMLWKIGEGNAKVIQPVRDRMVADLQKVYGTKLKPWLGDWKDLAKSDLR